MPATTFLRRCLGLLLLLLLFTAAPQFSQVQMPSAQPPSHGKSGAPTTRSIEGRVLSPAGSPLPGAVVLLKDTKTLQVRSYIVQADGRYHFFGLSTDINYELRAESNGMTSKTKTVSVFNGHKQVLLDLKLVKKIKS